ncbi:hypothetical protein [Mucilaginibacter sp.]
MMVIAWWRLDASLRSSMTRVVIAWWLTHSAFALLPARPTEEGNFNCVIALPLTQPCLCAPGQRAVTRRNSP